MRNYWLDLKKSRAIKEAEDMWNEVRERNKMRNISRAIKEAKDIWNEVREREKMRNILTRYKKKGKK